MNTNFPHLLLTGFLLIACADKIVAQDMMGSSERVTNLTNLIWGKVTAEHTISISTIKTNYLSGEQIDLRILVKNVGTNQMLLTTTGDPSENTDVTIMLFSFTFVVRQNG